jgi:hypothetical protein
LINRHRPSASAQYFHGIATASRKINRWPEKDPHPERVYLFAQPVEEDLRISVAPATSQMRVPDGRDIIVSSRSIRGSAQSATPTTFSSVILPWRNSTQEVALA